MPTRNSSALAASPARSSGDSVDGARELVGARQHVAELPAPVVPLRVGDVGAADRRPSGERAGRWTTARCVARARGAARRARPSVERQRGQLGVVDEPRGARRRVAGGRAAPPIDAREVVEDHEVVVVAECARRRTRACRPRRRGRSPRGPRARPPARASRRPRACRRARSTGLAGRPAALDQEHARSRRTRTRRRATTGSRPRSAALGFRSPSAVPSSSASLRGVPPASSRRSCTSVARRAQRREEQCSWSGFFAMHTRRPCQIRRCAKHRPLLARHQPHQVLLDLHRIGLRRQAEPLRRAA